jgi:hypothetical protein
MNVGSLYLHYERRFILKANIMKMSLLTKVVLVLPLIVFGDYMLMVLLGCASYLFGPDEHYYCGPFCIAGKIVLVLSAIFFGYIIYPDIKQTLKEHKDAKATKKQENRYSSQNERF